eukprot:gene13783-29307_t
MFRLIARVRPNGCDKFLVGKHLRYPPMASAHRTLSSLSDVLTNELMEESSNDQIDQEFLDIKQQIMKSFSIKEEMGISKVQLHRKYKAEQILVSFDIQDEEEDDSIPEDFDSEQQDEDEPDDSRKYFVNFEVVLTKGDEKLHFNCLAGDTLNVRNVAFIPPSKEINDSELYSGPVYEYLDEEVRKSFIDYLAERNIDDDLCFFILSFSRNKEQREYEGWLKNLITFVEKK